MSALAGARDAMVVLVHQDRAEHIDGLRLAVASVRRHCPDVRVLASCPNATDELMQWLSLVGAHPFQAGAEVAGSGWNAKPGLLLRALEQHGVVLWIDADVILTADPRPLLPTDAHVFVAAQEFAWAQLPGSAVRTSGWGLPPGRRLHCTVNSGVLRVSGYHEHVLRTWGELLERADYRAAQRQPALTRPVHMVSDQDALTALLGAAPFADLPLHLLRSGRDIAQCAGPAGFTVSERLRSLATGVPPLLHSVGIKPWQHGATWRYAGNRLARLRARYEDVHVRLSPYSIAARELGPCAGVSCERFAPRNAIERGLLLLGRCRPQLPELPLAMLDSSVRWIRKRIGVGRFAGPSDAPVAR